MGERRPGVDQETIGGADRIDQSDLHHLASAVLGLTQGEAIDVDPQHGHRGGDVAAGDAVLGAAVVGHSITLALSSSSSCS